MSALLTSNEFEALKSNIVLFPEENVNGFGLDNPESRGIFIPPSDVFGRPDITGYILASSNNEGKLEWVQDPTWNLKLGDLADVDTTGVTDGQVIIYDAATQTWIPGDRGGSPGGPFNSIQFNDNGTFNGNAGLLYDGTNITLLGQINAGTFTDGTTVITGGNLTGANSLTSTIVNSNILNLLDADRSDSVSLSVPAVTTGYSLVFPNAQGLAGTVLENDGLGNLSWQPNGGAGGTPAGPVNSVQFNNAGLFGGSANFTWDGTDVTVTGGDINADNFNATSDRRLKIDIVPVTNALDTINKIDGFTYNW